MPDIIDILPDHVANQIAAGEVIQRPASVVKELLENAIDAGATSVQLIVKDAGRTLIHVKDNGCGMTPGDARRSFERHATSKIRDAADIFSIRTKGFRGEALASIAAVAQVEMITGRPEDELGTRIVIEGSDVRHEEPAGSQNGTSILVKNLFFNIPARRNFLKSNPVETRHILDEFHRIALAHAGVEFSLYHNDNEVYQLPSGNLRQRLVGLFGKNFNQRLVPVEEDTDLALIRGFIGKPEYCRKTRGEQFFFVNHRFIKSPYLHHAVQFAYKELIQQDAYPSYFLFLEIDPAKIDVNIHPTKTEIKFEDEKALYAIIQATVKRSLGQYNIAPTIDFEQETAFSYVPPPAGEQSPAPPGISVTPGYNPFQSGENRHAASRKDAFRLSGQLYAPPSPAPEETPPEKEQTLSAAWDKEHDDADGKVRAQLHNTYILSQIKSGLLVIDQQLAHQRILYERFLQHLEQAQGPSQQLLFPENVELSPEDFNILTEMEEEVTRLGFDIRRFGKNTLVVHGVPADLPESAAGEQLEKLVEQFKTNKAKLNLDLRDNLARCLARNAAIRPGKRLSREEMDNMIDELFSCAQPNLSPDGKPTMTTLTMEGLQQNFRGR